MTLAKLRKLNRPIVPSDLRNPKRKSGYSYVQEDDQSGGPKPFQAFSYVPGGGPSRPRAYTGTRRATALEAAQDFCDWFNGNPVQAPVTLVTAGHEYEVDKLDNDPEVQAALGVLRDRKAQRAGRQGYVYLIVESHPITGARDLTYGKIGYSTNPRKRVAELQTGNWRPLSLVAMKPGTEADERALHRKYIKYNTMQEWFRLTAGLLLEFQDHFVDGPTKVIERKAA